MSLTQADDVFISAHEDALNDLILAFATDRPRLLSYGSPAFVPVTTVAETRMDAIGFPGTGGIEWRLRFGVPRIDLFKQTDPLPPELTLGPGAFSIHLGAELCLDCRKLRIDPHPPKPPREREWPWDDHKPDDHPDDHPDDRPDDGHPLREVTCCKLEIFAVGHIERVSTTTGEDAITFVVEAVEIVDIAPNEVEQVLECLLFMILQAVLATVRIPLRALRAGAFELSVTQGPLIEDDQIKARGDF